jgi:SET domain-containing protein
MSSLNFESFVKNNTQLIIDSNNHIDTLNKSKSDYELIKIDIDLNKPSNIALCNQFDHVLMLGFKRIEERKLEALDTSCPFSFPF